MAIDEAFDLGYKIMSEITVRILIIDVFSARKQAVLFLNDGRFGFV